MLPFVIKIFVLSIFEWPFKTGLTVCVFQWTNVQRCFGRIFLHFTGLWLKNAKSFLEENKGVECTFYKKNRATGDNYPKTPNTSFLLMNDFLSFF